MINWFYLVLVHLCYDQFCCKLCVYCPFKSVGGPSHEPVSQLSPWRVSPGGALGSPNGKIHLPSPSMTSSREQALTHTSISHTHTQTLSVLSTTTDSMSSLCSCWGDRVGLQMWLLCQHMQPAPPLLWPCPGKWQHMIPHVFFFLFPVHRVLMLQLRR